MRRGTQRLAIRLLWICKLWARISVPVPMSEVPCILDLFWSVSVCVCVCISLSAVFPLPPASEKYLWRKGLGWFFSKVRGRFTSSFLFPPSMCRAALRVMSLPLWIKMDRQQRGRPRCRINLFDLHHCLQRGSRPMITLLPKGLHPLFISPEGWEKLVRFCQLAKARPHSCSQGPVGWYGGRGRNGPVWFAITL